MVDPPTISIYDSRAAEYNGVRAPIRSAEAKHFGAGIDGWRIDVGCGSGRYLGDLGQPVVGVDASTSMLAIARGAHPDRPLVMADLARLPFRGGSLRGAWANMSYHHLGRAEAPMALARLHQTLTVGAPLDITTVRGEYEGHDLPGDDFPGRFFACWDEIGLSDLLTGAGFEIDDLGLNGPNLWARARRAHTLADTVSAGMRVLICGLNPSLHSANRGVGYIGPGNRFWPAAIAAGLVSRIDPDHCLTVHGVGITDLVKRATPRAAELTLGEMTSGMDRLTRLVTWLQPESVAFVGLQGYRAVLDKAARPGWQPSRIAKRPVYVLPSTSGMNARTSLTDLTNHFRTLVGRLQ